jgi:hypothetical protein
MTVVRTNANLLPIRSPSLPKIAPPAGLTAAPATKAPTAGMIGGMLALAGKNIADRTTTSEPYTKRSYHSTTLPTSAAIRIL